MAERVLITGCRGQLGTDLMKHLGERYDVTGVDLNDFDICDRSEVFRAVDRMRPEIVLHAAAFTNVDACETDEGMATSVNADATGYIAEACKRVGARLVYYSTDYVFDGTSKRPYTETDPPSPRTAYGRSKLAGEKRVEDALDNYVIMRLAWVYGFHGKNFVRTMIKLGYDQTRAVQRGEIITPLKVVDDQVGNPSWTMDIVRQTERVMTSNLSGIVHATAEGEVSWYGFARAIFEALGLTIQVRPCTTAEFPRPAPRPAYSALENSRLKAAGMNVMRDWREALGEFCTGQKEALLSCNQP